MDAFKTIDKTFCQKAVNHCVDIMNRAMELEKLIDVEVRPVIFSEDAEVCDYELYLVLFSILTVQLDCCT